MAGSSQMKLLRQVREKVVEANSLLLEAEDLMNDIDTDDEELVELVQSVVADTQEILDIIGG